MKRLILILFSLCASAWADDKPEPIAVLACGPESGLAVAPSYHALVSPEAVHFQAGPLGASTASLTLRLEDDSARPTVSVQGRCVRIARDGFEEVYEARPEGLKQSFHFPAHPGGSGDLVVRLRLDTELQPIGVSPVGITFAAGGRHVVHVGAVLGIDAMGWEMQGELRLEGELLELALPRAFVDAASYPLILDPLISALIEVEGPLDDVWQTAPDVAWDWTTRRFCLAWTRTYVVEGNRSETYAQLFEQDGTPASDPTLIGAAVDDSYGIFPAVANLGGQSMFVVVSDASHGAHVPAQQLTAFSAESLDDRNWTTTHHVVTTMDIGGDPHAERSGVCLVWQDFTEPSIRAQIFDVNGLEWIEASGDSLEVGSSEFLGQGFAHPRISQANGEVGNWLVVWRFLGEGADEVCSAAVSHAGAHGPVTNWGAGSMPSCDGTGSLFMIAYDADFVSWEDPGRAIEARIVSVDAALGQTSLRVARVHETVAAEIFMPEVAYTAIKLHFEHEPTHVWSIAWGESETGTIRFRSFDQQLKPILGVLDVLTGSFRDVRIGSLRSAHVPGDLGVVHFALGMSITAGVFAAVATP